MAAKIDDNEVDEDEAVTKQEGQEYAKQINASFFQTSAKQNIGITKMFQTAAELCVSHQELRVDVDVSLSIQTLILSFCLQIEKSVGLE